MLKKLGVQTGDLLELSSADKIILRHGGGSCDRPCPYPKQSLRSTVSARKYPRQTRSFMAGISDQKLMVGAIDNWDQAGGCVNLCEIFVHVKKSIRNTKRRVEL